MDHLEPYQRAYQRLLFAPVIRNLGVMNQMLIGRSLDLGMVAQARQLKRFDTHLQWLIKGDDDPDGDWDDIWADNDTERFSKHFDDHYRDFGAKDWNDYAKKSQDFYKQGLKEKFPAVRNKDDFIKIYDPKTNTFGVYNSEGKTATFYKPTSPTYFERQIEEAVNGGGKIINPLPGSESSGGGSGGGFGPFEKPGPLIHPTGLLPEE